MRFLKRYSDFINEATGFELKDDSVQKGAEVFGDLIGKYKGVKESPVGSNEGPEVSKWLRLSGVTPGLPWCMAFVYGFFDELASLMGISNPLPKTAGVIAHWDSTPPDLKINVEKAKEKMDLIKPGMVFIMHRSKTAGKALGHAGIVIGVDPVKKTFTAIEGNTNDMGSGEGDRVGINTRSIDDPLLIGFTDYFKATRNNDFEEALKKELDSSAGDEIERIKFKNPITHRS